MDRAWGRRNVIWLPGANLRPWALTLQLTAESEYCALE